jgi:hypothetical protein
MSRGDSWNCRRRGAFPYGEHFLLELLASLRRVFLSRVLGGEGIW